MKGAGSGGNQEFLDEQFEAQQEILRARRAGGLTKETLKKKYDDTAKTSASDNGASGTIREEESSKKPGGIKMPWEK